MQRSQRQPRSEHHHSLEDAEDRRDSKQLIQHSAPHHDGQVATQPQSSRGAPALRLDMDLDIDIELKAKIKGDVTLAILEGEKKQD